MHTDNAALAPTAEYTASGVRRIAALDSMRGLAALCVLFSHCLYTFPDIEAIANKGFSFLIYEDPSLVYSWVYFLYTTPLRMLWAGREAVILFFVHSGFVLALPFCAGLTPSFGPYAVKRLFRIYLPYVTAIVASMLLMPLLYDPHLTGLSSWFGTNWRPHLEPAAVTDNLLMLGTNRYNYLDSVAWSLIHEIRMSLVLPAIIYLTKRLPWPVVLTSSLAIAFASKALLTHPIHILHLDAIPTTVLETGWFSLYFTLGVLYAVHRTTLDNWASGLSRRQKEALAIAAVYLYLCHALFSFIPFIYEPLTGLGALLLILLAVNSRTVRQWLEQPPLQWLGKVSYSLYLVHAIVIVALVHGLHRFAPIPLIIALVPPISLVLAGLMHRTVEVPSITLGRQAAGRLAAFVSGIQKP